MKRIEPKIHGHIEDLLEKNHPLAFKSVHCKDCESLVHAANNECMSTWVETGIGNYCLRCFIKMLNKRDCIECFDDDLALEDGRWQ